jgi:hypothetical protein
MNGNLKKAQLFYDQGIRFMHCAERSMGEKNDDGSISIIGGKYETLSSPTMVNTAFACELFLKSILILNNIDYRKIHGLKPLYDLLPNQGYKNFLKIEPSIGKTFEEEMEKHSLDFINWRYYMESPGNCRMSPTFTFILMNNLKILTKGLIDNVQLG